MGRFSRFTGEYDPAWEETVGNQLAKMQDMTGREYFEIWYDPDEYLTGGFVSKLYDSYHDDDTTLKAATGRTIGEFRGCVIPRAGCAYSLTPEFYKKNTGKDFPEYIEDSAIIVIRFSAGWFEQHYDR